MDLTVPPGRGSSRLTLYSKPRVVRGESTYFSQQDFPSPPHPHKLGVRDAPIPTFPVVPGSESSRDRRVPTSRSRFSPPQRVPVRRSCLRPDFRSPTQGERPRTDGQDVPHVEVELKVPRGAGPEGRVSVVSGPSQTSEKRTPAGETTEEEEEEEEGESLRWESK